MARNRKARLKPKITLPPFEWETHTVTADGQRVRLGRSEVEQVDIDIESVQGSDGALVVRRARVWKTKTPPIMRNLNPAARCAVFDYIEATEVVGGSVGGSDAGGTGSSSATASPGPSLRILAAAERLRHMRASLEGGELVVPIKDARRYRRGDGMVRVPFGQLITWVAIDELSRNTILERAGAATSNEAAQDAVMLAIRDMAECLAICCGYVVGPFGLPKLRNTPGG
ncbi:hypothetical protein [Falsiruegeria litorea]|uniref:hypothetical protein n=1 Tax=Falsiruegeria litorea TaxID=1280831 RepID=UPI001BFD125E|nr:hypothetical protein [Falsiruegeria litorea]MBT8169886.1 hypothetical protein [Falsiruegeria litorea]